MTTPIPDSDVNGVLVAIITYRRPELLSIALQAVLAQVRAAPMRAGVVVVDNDPAQSGRIVVENVGSSLIRYVAEPEPGIPAARNAALDAACGHRLLAFIDDDELPEAGWLQTLLLSWERWQCDGIAGPTIRVLDGSEEPWVRASGFFEPMGRRDGAVLRGAPSGNLLLDMWTVRRLGLRFDARFATTGGSDSYFTRQLTEGGGVIRWCAAAVTTEPVPADRATRTWVLMRDRRIGNGWSRVHLMLARSRTARATTTIWLVSGAFRLTVAGGSKSIIGRVRHDIEAKARGERDLARAAGLILGVFGFPIEEYRRT